MLPVTALVFIFIVLFITFVLKVVKSKHENFPPGPPKLPFWGGYWYLLKENYHHAHLALHALHKKYKTNILGFYMGEVPLVSVQNYALCKEVLTRDEFTGRSDNVAIRNRTGGRLLGIFFSDGEFWKDQRWFSLRYMRDYGFGRRDQSMEDVAADEVRYMINFFTNKPKKEDSDICDKQGIVLMPDLFYGPAVNCIQHTLSATHFDDYSELRTIGRAGTKFVKIIDATGNAICTTPWLRYLKGNYLKYWEDTKKAFEPVYNFSKRIVDDHKSSYVEGYPRDFIDVYLNEMQFLQNNNKGETSFDDEQLIFTVSDYIFPASVGIGHTLNYLFAYLISNPEIQTKMQEEIDRVVGRARLPTLDDRKDMPYNEATIREAMRKDTLVPLGLTRRATQDTTLGGYFIPKDTIFLTNLWKMHNDPEIWEDPSSFKPEHFLDESRICLKKDMSLPFGAGKRLCAGETFARNTMFIFVTGIMQNFTVKTPEGKMKPNFTDQLNGLTLSLSDYWMEVVPRN